MSEYIPVFSAECLDNWRHCRRVYIRLHSATIVRPWLITWSTIVAHISSETALCLCILPPLPLFVWQYPYSWISPVISLDRMCDWLMLRFEKLPFISDFQVSTDNLPIQQMLQNFQINASYGIYAWEILTGLLSWIIVHVMTYTLKEFLHVLERTTIQLRSNIISFDQQDICIW